MHPATGFEPQAQRALRLAAAILDAAQHHAGGEPMPMCQALTAMARCFRALQQWDSAETYFEQALGWARAVGTQDPVVDLLCELCDTAASLAATEDEQWPGAGHAALERARGHAFEATLLACRVADSAWEAKVLLRLSDVLDRCGDRDDAVLLQTRALRLMSGSLPGGGLDPTLLPSLGRLADG